MVEVAADSPLLGPHGPVTLLDAFEGRRQLIAYYFMWWPGRPAAEQCEGCTWVMSHVGELAYLHSRDITFAVLCQGRNTAYGPGDAQTSYDESLRYRTFMGWDMPWYSAQPSLDTLLVGPRARSIPPGVLPARWRPGLRDVLDQTSWCRGAGLQLRAHGPHRVRQAGELGGLTCGLAAARTRDPDPGRGSGVAAPVGVAGRSTHLAMATARSRVLGRSGSGGRGCCASSGSLPLRGLAVGERVPMPDQGQSSVRHAVVELDDAVCPIVPHRAKQAAVCGPCWAELAAHLPPQSN